MKRFSVEKRKVRRYSPRAAWTRARLAELAAMLRDADRRARARRRDALRAVRALIFNVPEAR